FTISASDVYQSWPNKIDEQVLIQGVIDCLIPKEDGWIILDYKTDSIHEKMTVKVKERLITRYETQMDLYRQAIEFIWKQPVKKTYLYFLSQQLILEVPRVNVTDLS